jgi:hypothetical protein
VLEERDAPWQMMMGTMDSDYFLSAWLFGFMNRSKKRIELASSKWGVENRGDCNQRQLQVSMLVGDSLAI